MSLEFGLRDFAFGAQRKGGGHERSPGAPGAR